MKRIVFFLLSIFYFLFSHPASAAVLYTGSATQVVYQGDTFVLDWYLDTETVALNTVDLKITYSTQQLKVVEVSTGNSLLSLWIKQPIFDNSAGTIELTGGAPNGFNNSALPILRTTFEAVGTGNAKISIDGKSMVLRNDGFGTYDTLKFKPVEFPVVESNLKPSDISSPTHPDQNVWYRQRNVTISFETKSNTEYSFVFTSNSEVFPDNSPEQILPPPEYKNMPDGIYYFKLNSKTTDSPWQEAGVYRVQIDTLPPEVFVPEIGTDPNVFKGDEFLSFSTVDKTSGISHYKVKSGLMGIWKTATSPYKLQRPLIGNEIKVLAIDKAGNERLAALPYKGLIPVWLSIVLGIGILVGIGFLLRILRRTLMREKNETKQDNSETL